MLAIILILAGAFFRFLPHAPNVNPVAAIALFGAVTLSTKRLALIVPLCIMVLSDLFLGLHDLVAFTWGSVVLISLFGIALRGTRKTTVVLFGSLASSLAFFLITNFGVWLSGWYPLTLAGLQTCFINAIPFFRNFLTGTLAYAIVLFGTYELAARTIKNKKLVRALLTGR